MRIYGIVCRISRWKTVSYTQLDVYKRQEYTRIHKALQETVTSHGNGVKLLDRAVQAIYKMNDLANLLETDEGEDIVLRRLRIICLLYTSFGIYPLL